MRDFGAKGDGSTDDSDAIQRAVNAASAEAKNGKGGVAVFMPDGTYLISKRISIEQSGVVLRGSSVGAARRRRRLLSGCCLPLPAAEGGAGHDQGRPNSHLLRPLPLAACLPPTAAAAAEGQVQPLLLKAPQVGLWRLQLGIQRRLALVSALLRFHGSGSPRACLCRE